MSSIVLYLNPYFYASPPIFEQQHSKGAFSCVANAFSMCLSAIALASFKKDDLAKSVMAEAYNNSVDHQWSSFFGLPELSSVLKLPVESYFPILVHPNSLN